MPTSARRIAVIVKASAASAATVKSEGFHKYRGSSVFAAFGGSFTPTLSGPFRASGSGCPQLGAGEGQGPSPALISQRDAS